MTLKAAQPKFVRNDNMMTVWENKIFMRITNVSHGRGSYVTEVLCTATAIQEIFSASYKLDSYISKTASVYEKQIESLIICHEHHNSHDN